MITTHLWLIQLIILFCSSNFNREAMVWKGPIIRCLPRHHFLWDLHLVGLQTQWSKMLTLGSTNRALLHRLLKHHHHLSAKMEDVLGWNLGKSQLQWELKGSTVAETAASLLSLRWRYLFKYPQKQGETQKPQRHDLRERGTLFSCVYIEVKMLNHLLSFVLHQSKMYI